MDALGLIPESTPTTETEITFTASSLPAPTATIGEQAAPLPSSTSTAILPAISMASCVPSDTKRETGEVTQIVDGDTIVVQIDGNDYRVRYIGVDTAESGEQFGGQAADKNRELVAGKTVTLVKDVSETDQYDRLLRYVFVGDIFVNYELVRQGFAVSGTWPPDTSCDDTFRAAEEAAKSELVGIWLSQPPIAEPSPTTVGGETTGNIVIIKIFYDGVVSDKEPDEYVEIRNDGAESVNLQGWTLVDEADHTFRFPAYNFQPGEVCRIYTNEFHEESCGFNYGFTGSAIWNNGGDTAYLRDANGTLIDDYGY